MKKINALLFAALFCMAAADAQLAQGGTEYFQNGYHYHVFTSTTAAGQLMVTSPGGFEVFLVAGGGGGGGSNGGGGGAGGVVAFTPQQLSMGTVTVTVGAGGTGGGGWSANINHQGQRGMNSFFGTYLIAQGGGGGGEGSQAFSATMGDGGSGGGSAGWAMQASSQGQGVVGQGTTGQGHNGGANGYPDYGAGGGGAGAPGTDPQAGYVHADGGAGLQFTDLASLGGGIYGSPQGWFGGGGGGGTLGVPWYSNVAPSPAESRIQQTGGGGKGGGGGGSTASYPAPSSVSGTDGTGGGGGGAGYDGNGSTTVAGGNGGSGIVIVRYLVNTASTTIPVITGSASASAAVGIPFSYQVNAPGATSFAVASGTLPQGLSLNSINGLEYISGTPSAGSASATPYSITLTASNAGGTSVPFMLAITISTTSQSTGPSTWTDNGAGLLYNTLQANNVGIGTTAPASKLHIGAGNGDGLLIGNYNDRLGWDGSGIQPGHSIRFAGYRDIVPNMNGAKISALRTNYAAYPGYATGMDLAFYTQAFGNNRTGDESLVEALRIRDNGNVGIGTAAPNTRLEVNSGTAGGSGLRFTNLTSSSQTGSGQPLGVDANGNVVTVPASVSGFNGDYNSLANKPNNFLPSYEATVSGTLLAQAFNLPSYQNKDAKLDFITNDGHQGGGFGLILTDYMVSPIVWLYNNIPNAFTVGIKSYTEGGPSTAANNMTAAFQVRQDGKVLIGKTSSAAGTSYLLDVAGSVRANKLVVNATGADFVFSPSYKLRPLAGLKSYVERNRHLPGIVPAAEMQKDGVEVGESQTKLLQKIEELTLYIIQQDEALSSQDKKIDQQEKRISRLEQKTRK